MKNHISQPPLRLGKGLPYDCVSRHGMHNFEGMGVPFSSLLLEAQCDGWDSIGHLGP